MAGCAGSGPGGRPPSPLILTGEVAWPVLRRHVPHSLPHRRDLVQRRVEPSSNVATVEGHGHPPDVAHPHDPDIPRLLHALHPAIDAGRLEEPSSRPSTRGRAPEGRGERSQGGEGQHEGRAPRATGGTGDLHLGGLLEVGARRQGGRNLHARGREEPGSYRPAPSPRPSPTVQYDRASPRPWWVVTPADGWRSNGPNGSAHATPAAQATAGSPSE